MTLFFRTCPQNPWVSHTLYCSGVQEKFSNILTKQSAPYLQKKVSLEKNVEDRSSEVHNIVLFSASLPWLQNCNHRYIKALLLYLLTQRRSTRIIDNTTCRYACNKRETQELFPSLFADYVRACVQFHGSRQLNV